MKIKVNVPDICNIEFHATINELRFIKENISELLDNPVVTNEIRKAFNLEPIKDAEVEPEEDGIAMTIHEETKVYENKTFKCCTFMHKDGQWDNNRSKAIEKWLKQKKISVNKDASIAGDYKIRYNLDSDELIELGHYLDKNNPNEYDTDELLVR